MKLVFSLGGLVLASWAFASPAYGQSEATAEAEIPQSFADLERSVRDGCEQGHFSGVVLVQQGSQELLKLACSPDASADPGNALYKIFSTSKTITGAAILSLADDGMIDLDAPITRYLDPAPKIWSVVTVQQLLNHTSGIPDHTGALLQRWTKHEAKSYREAMDGLVLELSATEKSLGSAPGEKWSYSNFGYELLAQIASNIAGKPFDQVVEEHVFGPAGMSTAEMAKPLVEDDEVTGSQPVSSLIQGYNGAPDKLEEATSYSFVQWGAGAILASAADMAAFADAMDRGAIVDPALFGAQLGKAHPVNENVTYGPGVMLRLTNGCRVLQHSGGTNGYISDLSRVPSINASVVILSNYGFAKTREFSKAALELLTEESGCAE